MAMPPRSAAHVVFTDGCLLLYITSLQSGLPRDVVELARAHRVEFAKRPVRHVFPQWLPGGLLPTIAVEQNNLKLLRRVYRYYQDQRVYQTDPKYMAFRFVWRDCLKYGDLALIEWVNVQPALRNGATRRIMSHEVSQALANEDTEIVKWLLTNRPEYKTEIWPHHLAFLVCQRSQLPLFQWLEANIPNLRYDVSVMNKAAGAGNLEWVQYFHAHHVRYDASVMDEASGGENRELIQCLHAGRTEGCTSKAMDNAAKHGHLDVVRFLHEHRTEGSTTDAMDFAAEEGHLEVVRFLHEHRTEGCTVQAVDKAGSLQVLLFLLKNRTEGCTRNAIDHAATHGKLDIVRYLHENRTEGCTTKAMDSAAESGHLEIVQFLHEKRTEGCTPRAVDGAAKNGHMEVVQFLLTERKVRDTRIAMQGAAENGHFEMVRRLSHTHGLQSDYWSAATAAARQGHLEIVQFIVDVAPTSVIQGAHKAAAEQGHLAIVQFLHERFHEHCCPDTMYGAAYHGHFEIVKYLNENCRISRGNALTAAAGYGYLRTVHYLVEHGTGGRDLNSLVRAKEMAQTVGHPLVVDYLTSLIDRAVHKYRGDWFMTKPLTKRSQS